MCKGLFLSCFTHKQGVGFLPGGQVARTAACWQNDVTNRSHTARNGLLVLLLLLVVPFSGRAQDSDFGNWLIYLGNKQIDQKWNWHHEVQYRNYDAVGDLEQLLLRTGIGYNLTENNNNILLGYGFIHSQNYVPGTDEKEAVDEHRIFQQFITRQNIGLVKVQHRYRFEQRWLAEDFKLRFRYFLAFNIPLNGREIRTNSVYLSIYNEIFLDTTDRVFDRNRLYGGLGYQLNDKLRTELGYMNQFLPDGNRDQLNLITFLTF